MNRDGIPDEPELSEDEHNDLVLQNLLAEQDAAWDAHDMKTYKKMKAAVKRQEAKIRAKTLKTRSAQ